MVQMPGQRTPCEPGSHDYGAMFATRLPRNSAYDPVNTKATMIVRACRRCGHRKE